MMEYYIVKGYPEKSYEIRRKAWHAGESEHVAHCDTYRQAQEHIKALRALYRT